MDGSEQDHSEDDGSNEGLDENSKEIIPVDLYTAIWEHYLPSAMTFGIPFDVFWELCPKTLKPFQKMYENRKKAYLVEQEMIAHVQGYYNMFAIANVMNGKKSPYPKKPTGFFKFEEDIDPEIEKKLILQRAEAWAIDNNCKGLPDSGMK